MAAGVSTEVASAREAADSEGGDSITLAAALMAAILTTEAALGVGLGFYGLYAGYPYYSYVCDPYEHHYYGCYY